MNEVSSGTHRVRMGSWFAYASGVIAALGVVFFIARFALPRPSPLGGLNDVASLLQYLLAIPIALSLEELLRPRHRVWARATTIIGISGMLAIVALQFLLLARVLTFEQQGVPVSIAVLVVGVWLVGTGYLLRSASTFRHSLTIGLLAVQYFAYPIWAFWMGRRLARAALLTEQGGKILEQRSDS